jgi:hypothetical protein
LRDYSFCFARINSKFCHFSPHSEEATLLSATTTWRKVVRLACSRGILPLITAP